jgi:hypothetical protein
MDEIGVRIHIRDSMTLDDVGDCTAPGPVKPDDIVALEHDELYRIIATLPAPDGVTVVPVLAKRIAFIVATR